MNNLPRQKLKKIIAQYGLSLCDEPKRCEALLRDFCGQYRKEIAVLVGALNERVPADLLASQNSVPSVVLLARLTKKLQNNLGLAEESARWAVESWGFALDVIAEADTISVDLSSPSPQVPPQYRQENVNQTPATSNQTSSPPPQVPSQYRQENVVPKKETDRPLQPIRPTVVTKDHLSLNKANNQIKVAWITGTVLGVSTLLTFFSVFVFGKIVIGNFFLTSFLGRTGLFIDAFSTLGLSFGIYKKSRVCATIMFIYVIFGEILGLSGNVLGLLGLIISIALVYFFWQGVQGTFAYHKIIKP